MLTNKVAKRYKSVIFEQIRFPHCLSRTLSEVELRYGVAIPEGKIFILMPKRFRVKT